ncbi:hypothetical protein BS630_00835 [Rhizobium laguerreae]|nr:hypothetical protein BS630_00835 [Rhizobium laguerreae]
MPEVPGSATAPRFRKTRLGLIDACPARLRPSRRSACEDRQPDRNAAKTPPERGFQRIEAEPAEQLAHILNSIDIQKSRQ